jgi:hypothetical protein
VGLGAFSDEALPAVALDQLVDGPPVPATAAFTDDAEEPGRSPDASQWH